MTGLTGLLWTPNYPNYYKRNHLCEWRIHLPLNYTVSLEFVDFDLEQTTLCLDERCQCDHVDIVEVFPNGSEATLGLYCMGVRYPTNPIVSNTNIMVVKFTPDYSIEAKGFKARYTAVINKGMRVKGEKRVARG